MDKKIVNVYIDWFNLYHALKTHIKNWKNSWEKELQWCNLYDLCKSYLKKGERLWEIYFFTADSWDKDTKQRWKTYFRALNEHKINIIKWKYNRITRTFIDKMKVLLFKLWVDIWDEELNKYLPKILRYCTYEEKRTDVNIAVKIVEDAFLWKYDKAFIMSWDSDIIPAIQSVKKNFDNIKFTTFRIVWTKWQLIKNMCDENIVIWYKEMKKFKFPDNITAKNGDIINIPSEWK